MAKYFHITGEAEGELRPGFNFYPWGERHWSVGFRFLAGPLLFRIRWRRGGLKPRFLVRANLYSPEQRCKRCAKLFGSGMVMVPREVALDAGITC